jgi:hypothetical protein
LWGYLPYESYYDLHLLTGLVPIANYWKEACLFAHIKIPLHKNTGSKLKKRKELSKV